MCYDNTTVYKRVKAYLVILFKQTGNIAASVTAGEHVYTRIPHRSWFLVLAALLCFFSAPVYAEREHTLLYVDSQESEPYNSMREMIMYHLEREGYTAGNNLELSYWSIGNASGLATRVWRTEKDKHYDAIYLGGTMATKYFKDFTFDNPNYKCVFGTVTNPIELGVIDKYNAPPKANFTGVSYPVDVASRLRFIQTIMPEAINIGYVYADMSQSISYLNELKSVLNQREFERLKFHYRKVEFVPGEGGHIRMARLAKKYVDELSDSVDLFLSPNDQMGAQKEYVEMVIQNTDKPLIALGRKDVMEWGAPISYYPSTYDTGRQISKMLVKLFEGADISTLYPEKPDPGVAINMKLAAHYNFFLPDRLIEQAGEDLIW